MKDVTSLDSDNIRLLRLLIPNFSQSGGAPPPNYTAVPVNQVSNKVPHSPPCNCILHLATAFFTLQPRISPFIRRSQYLKYEMLLSSSLSISHR